MRFQETKLVSFAADLAGFARSTAGLEALKVAAFLDDWYRQCAEAVRDVLQGHQVHGRRVPGDVPRGPLCGSGRRRARPARGD